MDKKKVHLVLGSGGARGIAHIAIIEELEKDGYEIIEIIGCSMGAVIGGIYASGHLQNYKKWLLGLSRRDVFDLMDFTFTNQGFVKGEKIFNKHKEITGDLNIEDFNIPFTAIATDMRHQKEVHYTKGDLYKALRASVAIPGFILPVVENGNVLVDGGVSNPLPVNLVKKQKDAITVVVDLNAIEDKNYAFKVTKKEKNEVKKWFENLLPENIKAPLATLEKEEKEIHYSLVELMQSTYSFTQDRLKDLMLDKHKPDILFKIPRNTANTFDFDKGNHIYKMGKKAYVEFMKPK